MSTRTLADMYLAAEPTPANGPRPAAQSAGYAHTEMAPIDPGFAASAARPIAGPSRHAPPTAAERAAQRVLELARELARLRRELAARLPRTVAYHHRKRECIQLATAIADAADALVTAEAAPHAR